MKYPNFIKKGDTIGICAPSAGVGQKLDSYLESLKVLKAEGYKIKESKHVRSKGERSCSFKARAKEFYELTADKDVDMIMFASGGDYMYEMMPYVKYDKLMQNPKWLMGMSDPTNILLDVTCLLDIATIYGTNASGFSLNTPDYQRVTLDYLKGDIKKQKSYKKYITCLEKYEGETKLKNKVNWLSKDSVDIEGRIIGGCFDVMLNHMGTFLDNMNSFVARYADDGIIWYLDVFSRTPLDFYLGLLQMKYAGLFVNCKGVLIGRVALPSGDKKFDYIKAANKALGNIPHIMEMDIGHTDPYMTIINGSYAHVKCSNGKGEISFKLK